MTLPKDSLICPICKAMRVAMRKHLTEGHDIKKREERLLLVNLASGRINIRGQPCNVPGCSYASSRLDLHIFEYHTKLSQELRRNYLGHAKRSVFNAKMADLRASEPAVPIVSQLDLEDLWGQEEGPPDMGAPMAEHEEAGPSSCGNAECQELKKENQRMKERMALLQSRNQQLEKLLKKLRPVSF